MVALRSPARSLGIMRRCGCAWARSQGCGVSSGVGVDGEGISGNRAAMRSTAQGGWIGPVCAANLCAKIAQTFQQYFIIGGGLLSTPNFRVGCNRNGCNQACQRSRADTGGSKPCPVRWAVDTPSPLRLIFPKSDLTNPLGAAIVCANNRISRSTLIQRGGGTGPVKPRQPGNRWQRSGLER